MITIPTTSQLYNAVLSDLQAAYGSSIPLFGKNFLRVLAGVQAGKLKLYYLAIAELQKNIFVDTADPESSGGTLERFGRVKLGRDPFPAQAGKYSVTVTGSTGAIIPAATTFKSNDDSINPGMLFILDVAHALVASSDTITIRALTPGAGSMLAIGDNLTATAPIIGVSSTATVASEVVEPLDAENIEDYRDKAIEAYQLEPQGGAATDYRLWAFDAQGVEQTYPYAKSGASNEINLFVEATLADSTDGKGTPSAALLLDVQSVVEFDPDTSKPLNERGRRPLGVFQVHYLPVTIKTIDIVIPDFVGLTPDIQSLIYSALKEHIDAIRPFVAAADVLADKNDILDVNQITSVILLARPGSSFGAVTFTVDGVPFSSYQFVDGNIPFFNSVTYP